MKIYVTIDSMKKASRMGRLGRMTAEKHLGRAYLEDVDEYGGLLYWESNKGRCVTNYKGDLLRLELEV